MEPAAPHRDPEGEALFVSARLSPADGRQPAYNRLEEALGGHLTHLLVTALATGLLRRGDDKLAA